jgi:hypothetical protein
MEVPRLWRTQQWRYGLRVRVADEGGVRNEVPTGIRDFVEANGQSDLTEALVFQALASVQKAETVS